MSILIKDRNSEFRVYCNEVSIVNGNISITDFISYDLRSFGSGMTIPLKEVMNYVFVQSSFSYGELRKIVSKRIKGEGNILFNPIGNKEKGN
ncbi:hypothetical protein M3621_04315 [Bacillus safensis]|uniref:hypothetical protein n=1 Tax=Bacillus safensis TaxID=561879 RepID=UPI002040C2C3|nr:hypothetical protein [Bacillus safensis]MCM3365999.1 hypothetical protein [Bacillus safensis]